MSARTDARAARLALERLLETTNAAPSIGDATIDRLERYTGLLLAANERLNLTRVVEPDAVARLHLLDALAALPLLDAQGPRLALDLGSGGGVPGIVLAIARPPIRWLLVDAASRKVAALRAFATELELTNVEAVADRAELLGRDPAHRERYDLVTARACAGLPVLVEYALPLLRVGGQLVAWKGPIGADELRAGAAAAEQLGGGPPVVRDPEIGPLGDHRFVLVGKTSPTPDRFPRRPGVASRRPLGC